MQKKKKKKMTAKFAPWTIGFYNVLLIGTIRKLVSNVLKDYR